MALAVCPARASDTKADVRGLSHYILGVYSEDLGDLDRAVQEYTQALADDPQSALLQLSLASVYIRKNDLAPAARHLQAAVKLDPEDVQSRAVLVLVYAAQDKPLLAAQEYALALKNAVKLDPQNIEIYKSLGIVYLQQKKFKEAEGIFKLIVGMAPKDPQARLYLGNIYFELKDFASVEKELNTALKLNPNYHEALNFLGYFYLEQDRNIEAAGRLIKKALTFEPQNGAYLDSLGWYYFKKNKYQKALKYLEEAAALLSDPTIYDHLGETYLKLGNFDSAKLNWEKSLKLDSTQSSIKEKLFKLTHGK